MDSRKMHVQGPQIHQFNNVSVKKVPRSSFKRDFTLRTTFNSNDLVPIMIDEILPGDDIHLSINAQVRMTTPIKPIMDNLYLETFSFFVPNRLVWTNWEAFQGQIEPSAVLGTNPLTNYTIPVLDYTKAPMTTPGFSNNSIYDHFGLPTLVTGIGQYTPISAMFNRAYDLIWNEWFRDENLQASLTIQTGNGPDDPSTYALRKRNKRKDYFTSCLPWAQKAAPIALPLGTKAPVLLDPTVGNPIYTKNSATHALEASIASIGSDGSAQLLRNGGSGATLTLDPNGNWYADLSSATAATINALRQAALYQQILELDARAGSRYVESIYARFGVISPDFRLQRPELIGQGHSMVNLYAVPQTAPTSGGSTPQGNLAAYSATAVQGHSAKYSATEHGMIIVLANVRADLTYQQGLPKMFSRRTRLDYYEPLLNGLGEQAVLQAELYADGTSAEQGVFGYQERFSEYRYKNSEIHGVFRANDPQTLKVWNLSQQLSTPALNSTFITEAVPMDQILAVSTSLSPNFLADIAFGYNHVRPMPIRSTPGIDRL